MLILVDDAIHAVARLVELLDQRGELLILDLHLLIFLFELLLHQADIHHVKRHVAHAHHQYDLGHRQHIAFMDANRLRRAKTPPDNTKLENFSETNNTLCGELHNNKKRSSFGHKPFYFN